MYLEKRYILLTFYENSGVEMPEDEWTPEMLATVGEVFLEVTRILAHQWVTSRNMKGVEYEAMINFILKFWIRYGLSGYDIEKKLPLIDTLKTDLLHYCPDYLSPLYCTPGKYRRFDGLCNNLKHPTWGARLTPFTRWVFKKLQINRNLLMYNGTKLLQFEKKLPAK